MAHDYYLGRIGGARMWMWRIVPSPPEDPIIDVGITGRTIRRPYRLILGSPAAAKAFVWSVGRGTPVAAAAITIASGGSRIFRRRGMPVV